jgi:hypothetical protein
MLEFCVGSDVQFRGTLYIYMYIYIYIYITTELISKLKPVQTLATDQYNPHLNA